MMPRTNATTLDIDVAIGKSIRTIRTVRGLSQSALAETVGTTFQQIQKYEKGTNRVSTAILVMLCQKLQISPMDILGQFFGSATEVNSLADQNASLIQQLADLKAAIRSAAK